MQWSRWIEFGGDPDTFWRQTPLTFAVFMRGKAAAAKREHQGRQWLAWHVGYLYRVKDFPSWDEFTAVRREKTEEELMSMGRLMAAAGFATFHEPPAEADTPE